jgi:glyoxylase-like metal-dependent hydrolase (beta-lactamase superfamily II)
MIADVVAPGIMRLSTSMGPRRLGCYVLDDGPSCTIFDAALPGAIVQWLDTGACVQPVTRLVISHADADHVGDAAGLRARFEHLDVQCHPLDRRWIEDHDLLVAERYGEPCTRFGFGCADAGGGAGQDVLRALCGPNVTVNELLDDGDRLVIGARRWDVLHVPGHTRGHIALWDALEGVLLLGDAVLGFAIPSADDRPSMPPTHRYIAEYLSTIDRLTRMPVRLALSAHWPPLEGAAFRALLEQSRACVERDLAAIVSAFGAGPGGRSFADVVQVLNERHRLWPASEDGHYAFAAVGYVEHLVERGELSPHAVVAESDIMMGAS